MVVCLVYLGVHVFYRCFRLFFLRLQYSYDLVQDTFVVFCEGMNKVRVEIVGLWQIFAGQLYGFHVDDLELMKKGTLQFIMFSSLFNFLYFSLILRELTSRFPRLNLVQVAMVKQQTAEIKTSQIILGADNKQYVSRLIFTFILVKSSDISSLKLNSSRKDDDFCSPRRFLSVGSTFCSNSFLIFFTLLSIFCFHKYILFLCDK